MSILLLTLWLGDIKIDYVCSAERVYAGRPSTVVRKTKRPNGVDITYYSECRSA